LVTGYSSFCSSYVLQDNDVLAETNLIIVSNFVLDQNKSNILVVMKIVHGEPRKNCHHAEFKFIVEVLPFWVYNRKFILPLVVSISVWRSDPTVVHKKICVLRQHNKLKNVHSNSLSEEKNWYIFQQRQLDIFFTNGNIWKDIQIYISYNWDKNLTW